jgi:hypothetical protein
MNFAKRLEKIETSLTPKQAVLLWLKEVQQADEKHRENTLWALMPEAVWNRLSKIVEAQWRDTRNRISKNVDAILVSIGKGGRSPDFSPEPLLERWEQADFLVVLVQQLNADIVLDSRETGQNLSALFGGLGEMGREHKEPALFAECGGWRAGFVDTLTRLWLLKATIQAISKQYYDNHSILFADEETTLEEGIEFAESLANWYNHLEGALPGWTAIDLADLQSSIAAKVPAAVDEQVAQAQARILARNGHYKTAWELLKKFYRQKFPDLPPPSDCNTPG